VENTPDSHKEKREVVMLANGHPPFDTRIFVKECQSLKSGSNSGIWWLGQTDYKPMANSKKSLTAKQTSCISFTRF